MEQDYWERVRDPPRNIQLTDFLKNSVPIDKVIGLSELISCLQDFCNERRYSWSAQKRFTSIPSRKDCSFSQEITHDQKVLYEVYAQRGIDDIFDHDEIDACYRMHAVYVPFPRKIVASSFAQLSSIFTDNFGDEDEGPGNSKMNVLDELGKFMYDWMLITNQDEE
jgi:hypothetical protein